jgi:plasmid stabilization system protein ParE
LRLTPAAHGLFRELRTQGCVGFALHIFVEERSMPRGDKSSYTDKQKRKAEHIEEGYEDRGVSHEEAERRAWATVNKESGGGKKSGSGRGKRENRSASRKGGRKGGRAAASRSKAARSRSARKAARTRKRRKAS